MLRVLAVIAAGVVVVFVAAAVVKTFFWLSLIALIAATVCVALGFFRLGRRSGHRSRNRF
jgi:MFS superfamily sulfate permease-like transporter